MRRLPPLGALEAFVRVARDGSLKAAADTLALSPPAMTRRIQALELFVGGPLLARQHNGVTLNREGQALLDEIAPHLDALGAAVDRATSPRQNLRLRLAVPSLFGSQRLVPALAGLRQRAPHLHIDIDTGPDRLARLDDGIDAAIVIASKVEPRYSARLLMRDRVVALGAASMTQGENAIREPNDLRRVPILLHRDMIDSFTVWRDTFGFHGLEPLSVSQYDSGQMILDAAAAGMGVAFMLASHLELSVDKRLVQIFEESVESPYSYWFACTKPAMERPAVKIFHDWLFEQFAGP